METDIALIITVVNKGWGEKVLETTMKAGAHGGTILLGRGMGVHEKRTLLGISLEPEKEIVLSVVYSDRKEEILDEIVRATELEKPGAGIAFVLPIERVLGVSHLFNQASQCSTAENSQDGNPQCNTAENEQLENTV